LTISEIRREETRTRNKKKQQQNGIERKRIVKEFKSNKIRLEKSRPTHRLGTILKGEEEKGGRKSK